MKKLTAEEYEQLALGGRGRSGRIFNELLNLKKGEVLVVTKQDWGTRKHSPMRKARYIEKKYKRRFHSRRLLDGSGWAIQRTE